MPATKTYRTPGVYVAELDAFPASVVGVETAVPAFIGYTKKAEIDGKPIFFQPTKISSMADYEEIFGAGLPPRYAIAPVEDAESITAGNYDFKVFDPIEGIEKYYTLGENLSTRYALYACLRLFYDNGGGSCYIVSVGAYSTGVVEQDLIDGLDAIKEQQGPTMLVIPDAVLLPPSDVNGPLYVSASFQKVVRAMLEQCATLQDRVAILDVYGSRQADRNNWSKIIETFRIDVGEKALNYGMAYFPFLETSVVNANDFTYLNVDSASQATLREILTWENANLNNDGIDPAVSTTLRFDSVQVNIELTATTTNDSAGAVTKLNQNLVAALPLLTNIENLMAAKNSVLPPSAAMAGVFTYIDGTRGVWNAPANLALSSVIRPTFKIDNQQQENLNVPVDGKAVDAIREFTGRGTVVWGARTLDGNSRDWRYIQVRRTLIYVEQSIKAALDPYVFAANDGNTWVTVVAMVSSFLRDLWAKGGLLGSTAEEAFTVQCGLGSTMTAQDILDGYMIVQVTLQMIRPAEFIELTFKQTMQDAA